MANDLVVKLLLKTGAFGTDLKKAKGEIQEFKNDCKQAGGAIGELTKGLGINISSLTKFGGVVGLACAAVKGYSTVMKQNRDFMDDWGRATETAKGLWEGFKNSLANGAKIDATAIAETSKQYYDVLDNLRSVQHAIGVQLEINNTKYSHLISIARDVALADVDRLDALQKANELVEANIKLQKRQAQQEKNAADVDLRARLARNGVTDVDEKTLAAWLGLGDDGRFVYENRWEELNAAVERGKSYVNMSTSAGVISQPVYNEAAQTIMNSAQYKIAKALYNIGGSEKGQKAIDEYYTKVANNLGMEIAEYNAQQARTEIDKLRQRILGKEGGNTPGPTPPTPTSKNNAYDVNSIAYWEELIKKYKQEQEQVEINSERYRELGKIINYLQGEYDELIAKGTPLQKLDAEKLFPQLKNYGLGEISQPTLKMPKTEDIKKPAVDGAKAWEGFNETLAATSTIISNLTGLFDENGKITTESVLKMVATTLPAIGQMITAIGALTAAEATEAQVAATMKAVETSKHWIEAIAAVAALGGVVAASIAASKNAGNFANGGIVGGTSYTGDRLVANVNSGEMILNTTQQGKLWKQINNGGGSNQVEFHIAGTELVGVLNNNNRKTRLTR